MQQSKRIVAELPCSLSALDQENPVPRTWYSKLELIAIAMWQPILIQMPRETWTLPSTPSSFSALLKYTLQKINHNIAAQHSPEFVSLIAAWALKASVGAPHCSWTAEGVKALIPLGAFVLPSVLAVSQQIFFLYLRRSCCLLLHSSHHLFM
jgi:hypothetical protein